MRPILHSKPWLIEEDLAAIEEVFQSGMIAQGTKVQEFECALGNWFSIENGAVAVGSGAAALFLSLSALGVTRNDEVILPTYVCKSVLEAVLTTGATPVLCDVGPNWVVMHDNVVKHITENTKVLIVPHMYGIFADVASFHEFGIPIVEDCAQAFDYKGKRKIAGDIAIFSFHPTKCLTTGEGGMAISVKPQIVALMRSLRDGSEGTDMSRFFSPMSDIAASLGLSQLSRYHQMLDRRKELAMKYILNLERFLPDDIQYSTQENSMYFRFVAKVYGRIEAYQELFSEKNIIVRRGVDNLLHRLMNISDENFNESVKLYNVTISLPIYPALTDDEHSYCVNSAVEIFSKRP